jgi:hypothetical protein
MPETKTKKRKTPNPLYVVSKNKKDVEEASNILDLILKKTGVDKVIPVLETILSLILSQVETYPIFIEVKKMFDKLFEKFIEILFQVQNMMPKKS